MLHLARRARQGGDDDALAFSLWAHHDIIWGPGTAAERVALTGELIDVARRTADPDLEHFASALRWVAMIERGDPRYLGEFHAYAARGRAASARTSRCPSTSTRASSPASKAASPRPSRCWSPSIPRPGRITSSSCSSTTSGR
ncbi:hypothetical protein ACFQ0B_14060 [Nonomuraea thailandensis]